MHQNIDTRYSVDVFPICPTIHLETSPDITMTHEPVPTPELTTSSPLIEPLLAEALVAAENAQALSPDTRRHWACSLLRRIAEAIDRPLTLLPARWTALRIPVSR